MTGRLALSKQGHDKGKVYLIIKEEGNSLFLSDGAKRGLLAPKKKNKRHIQPIHGGFEETELESFFENPAWADEQIREKIAEFNRGRDPEQ